MQLTRQPKARSISLVLLLVSGAPAHAQGTEWETLNNEVEALYQKGQYERALVVAKKALAVADLAVDPNPHFVTTSLNNLALLYYAQGHYAQAEPLFKRALAIREKKLGSDHTDVAASLNNLAELYRVQGQYAQAEALYKRSLVLLDMGKKEEAVAQLLAITKSFANTNEAALATQQLQQIAPEALAPPPTPTPTPTRKRKP